MPHKKKWRVCLISPGHLSTNPRLVKEATALADAGFDVDVISGDYLPSARPRDAAILNQARWRSTIVPASPSRLTYLYRRLIQAGCRMLFSFGCQTESIAARAHHLIYPALKSAAFSQTADFYIGHCLASLPVVVAAGKKKRAIIGFDAEDLHSQEVDNTGRGRLDNAIARLLESKFLSQCHHLTAASPLIAQAYQQSYGVSLLPILNVFPLNEAVEPEPAPLIPSFYWFSQTIGQGRGLEAFIEILRHLRRSVRLDLRGAVSEAYANFLKGKVNGSLIELQFFPPDEPQAMVRHAAAYTAGLGLELRHPLNRDLCLTNKAFTYLLAGVPVILSRTKAQGQLACDLGQASLLIDLEQPDYSSDQLAKWLDNKELQHAARKEAFRLGRSHYNWDREQESYLAQIRFILENMRATY